MVRAGIKNYEFGSARSASSRLFVDFDNVYLSLRRQSEEAAGRFARNPQDWMSRIAQGGLIRYKTHQQAMRRRFAVARCYGNPGRMLVSRGGPHDPHAFSTVRTNFMIAGIEVVDCQPLSSQFQEWHGHSGSLRYTRFSRTPDPLRGVRDSLRATRISPPLLHHLRSHDRRTVVYANENTADIYKAFSDGWIEETGDDLVPDGRDDPVMLGEPARIAAIAWL